MKKLLLVVLGALVLSGCGVNIVPRPSAGGQIDARTNAITQARSDLTMSVRVQDLEVRPYQMVDNIVSFHIVAANHGGETMNVPIGGFILVDDAGNQYRPITPETVTEIVSRESFYLMPYPYVGFYYLEDAVKSSQFDRFDSSLPYFPERYPQDIYTQALPSGSVLPGNRISGLIYFIADLTRMKSFDLNYYFPHASLSEPPAFSFPFSVEKN